MTRWVLRRIQYKHAFVTSRKLELEMDTGNCITDLSLKLGSGSELGSGNPMFVYYQRDPLGRDDILITHRIRQFDDLVPRPSDIDSSH